MAVEWRERPLAELTDNFDAARMPVKEADRRPGPYPYYGASGVVDRVDSYLFDGEYLLIAEDGENLKTRNTPIAFLARGKFWVNNHAHIVRGNSEADTRFLMYALCATDIGGYLTGSTMPKLTQGNMNRISLLTPSLPEQLAIANILGNLDNKMEINNRMNETLETMAHAIFKSQFVDVLQPSLPKGWRMGKVEDLVTLSRESLKPEECPNDVFNHYSIPAFDEGRTPKQDMGSTIKSMKFKVLVNSVLLSKLNPRIPRVWLPELDGKDNAICSTEFLVAIPKRDVSREFLFCLFSSSWFMDLFAARVTGTSGSHQRVKPESLLSIDTVIPSQDSIDTFTKVAAPLLKKIGKNIFESQTLVSLRDTLLPKLISGELRVKNAYFVNTTAN